jgi:hypothetical protein
LPVDLAQLIPQYRELQKGSGEPNSTLLDVSTKVGFWKSSNFDREYRWLGQSSRDFGPSIGLESKRSCETWQSHEELQRRKLEPTSQRMLMRSLEKSYVEFQKRMLPLLYDPHRHATWPHYRLRLRLFRRRLRLFKTLPETECALHRHHLQHPS